MKKLKNMLFIGALQVALIGAFTSNADEMPAPFYGKHPVSGQCVVGTIDKRVCSTSILPILCSVTFSDGQSSVAFDDIASTTVCTAPVFRGLE